MIPSFSKSSIQRITSVFTSLPSFSFYYIHNHCINYEFKGETTLNMYSLGIIIYDDYYYVYVHVIDEEHNILDSFVPIEKRPRTLKQAIIDIQILVESLS